MILGFTINTNIVFRYFKQMLIALSSPPIYAKYIQLPDTTSPTPNEILNNPKFYPYFKDALGAIDGAYIPCYVPVKDQSTSQNQKGIISQNCLACVSFNLQFTYVLSRQERPASDAWVYHDACITDLYIPPGKYYLADTGFPACDELLVPYHGMHYHLAE